jgi:hypothetical protein
MSLKKLSFFEKNYLIVLIKFISEFLKILKRREFWKKKNQEQRREE